MGSHTWSSRLENENMKQFCYQFGLFSCLLAVMLPLIVDASYVSKKEHKNCHTEYETETSYEKRCSTTYEQECSTVKEEQCKPKVEEVCNTVDVQECSVSHERVCTEYEDK